MLDQKNPSISVVVPVYQEESSIDPFLKKIQPVLEKIGPYEIIFCVDPSPDNTEKIIEEKIKENSNIAMLVFSRRFGQPAATMAGILNCKGETCVIIDVDLQDPPELITTMYAKLKEGYEVVYAQRRSRKGETLIKRFISYMGYKVINSIADVRIPVNTGDFRIITRRVIEELRNLKETHGFLRGLVGFVGFNQTFIEYDRDDRSHGVGKYNRLTGSLKIGLNGIVSFSSRPLQLMSICGGFLAMFSFFLGAWYVFQKIIGMELTPGLPTMVLVVTFFSGIQLLSLGLIGEYIGRIYEEVKYRPMYIIDKRNNL